MRETLQITPTMQLGVTDYVWSIGELIDAALDGELPPDSGRDFPMNLPPRDPMPQPGKRRFSVIDGGST